MTPKALFMIGSVALSSFCISACRPSQALPPNVMRRMSTPSRFSPYPSSQNLARIRPTLPPADSSRSTKPATPVRNWKYIVIHHTASSQGNVESIHEAHLQRRDKSGKPWLGIGYHFVIGNGNGMTDGAYEETFRWRQQMHGAHAGVAGAPEYNEHGIGLVLVGNFENSPPTPAQLVTVKRLVARLSVEHGISSENIIGHSNVKATACPGKLFPLAEISQYVDGFAARNPSEVGIRPELIAKSEK